MELSQRERLMIGLALFCGAILISIKGYPALIASYENRKESIQSVEFLRKLETSSPKLRVTGFSFDKNNNQYVGSITVVGFARAIVRDSAV